MQNYLSASSYAVAAELICIVAATVDGRHQIHETAAEPLPAA
ncbi:hypothetical protein [Paraburkholderia diazotrophica]|nr:hypothetical protein [Paraburkholderia diazotrophica]